MINPTVLEMTSMPACDTFKGMETLETIFLAGQKICDIFCYTDGKELVSIASPSILSDHDALVLRNALKLMQGAER